MNYCDRWHTILNSAFRLAKGPWGVIEVAMQFAAEMLTEPGGIGRASEIWTAFAAEWNVKIQTFPNREYLAIVFLSTVEAYYRQLVKEIEAGS